VRLIPDLNDKAFDFSQESNLKEKLWEQILQRAGELEPMREEISLETITPQVKAHVPEPDDTPVPKKQEPKL